MNNTKSLIAAVVLGTFIGVLTVYETIGIISMVISVIGIMICYRYPLLMSIALPFAIFLWSPLASFGGFNVTWLDAILGLFYLHLVIYSREYLKKYHGCLASRHSFQLLILVWAPILFSILGAILYFGVDKAINSLLYIKRWCAYSILPVGMLMFCSKKDLKYVYIALAIANLLYFASTVLGIAVMGELSEFDKDRAAGLVFNPNVAGCVAVVLINVCLEMSSRESVRWLRVLWFCGIFMNLTILVSTGSREALIGLVVTGMMWTIIQGRKIWRYIPLVLVGVSLFLVMLSFSDVSNAMFKRVGEVFQLGSKEENVSTRLEAQKIGLGMLAQYPLGIGVGNINPVSCDFMFDREFTSRYVSVFSSGIGTSDNQFIDGIVENGILGELVFVAGLYWIYRVSLWTKARDMQVNLVMLSVVGMAGYTFYSPFIASLLWLILACRLIEAQVKEDSQA